MSTFRVPLTKILSISPHPDPETTGLEIANVYGFTVVIKKHIFNINDVVVYVPIDSILPSWLENIIFPEGSLIKLTNSRVRQIRLRKAASQGMLINPQDLQLKLGFDWWKKIDVETDLAEKLGVTKYEPPIPKYLLNMNNGPKARNKPLENPRFHKYNGLENIKWFPTLFKEGEEVVVQCKLHGTNARLSIQPTTANTLWRKILMFVGYLPKYETCWGSNNVQLQQKPGTTGYYGSDIYGAALQKEGAFEKVRPGETIYGEIIGEGIQDKYMYGHRGEHKFVLFDVKVTKEDGSQQYLNPEEAEEYANQRGFTFIPVLYRGPFVREQVEKLASGPSVYDGREKVREGIVIKARYDYDNGGGKKALKWINPDFLDKPNTDFQ